MQPQPVSKVQKSQKSYILLLPSRPIGPPFSSAENAQSIFVLSSLVLELSAGCICVRCNCGHKHTAHAYHTTRDLCQTSSKNSSICQSVVRASLFLLIDGSHTYLQHGPSFYFFPLSLYRTMCVCMYVRINPHAQARHGTRVREVLCQGFPACLRG